ncbi:ATP phosphoribosyltransferase [Propionibacteriaceae bacterium Y1923]|uniref:ATP phosphoribosyltransferase n=1 Tax=Aestuariimicrobium sp. Y1814 TaxID=3418742 RepID=UPI003C2A8532
MTQTPTASTTPNGGPIKIAVPNKGALSEAAAVMLREAGYRQRTDPKELVLTDEANGVEFYYLRPRDIAVYVGEGTLHLGITGRDMLIDSHTSAVEVTALGFGRSRFRFAAPADGGINEIEHLHGRRIATSYPGLVEQYLAGKNLSARLIPLDGAVESAIRLGVADAIADVVETGSTLRKAGLAVFGEAICESEAIVIRHHDLSLDNASVQQLLRRLDGVLVARSYVMVDYNVAQADLEAACELTPGLSGPTVSQLAKEGWVAVRSLVPRADSQRLLDDLYQVGARGILLTDLAACRL